MRILVGLKVKIYARIKYYEFFGLLSDSFFDETVLKLNYCKKVFFFLIHLFARDVLVMEKLEIEKTKPNFIMSVLKVENWVVLVSSISNFFNNKTSLANKWMSFSSSNSALVISKIFSLPSRISKVFLND